MVSNARVDEAYVEAFRAFAGAAPGGEVVQIGGVTIASCNSTIPMFNVGFAFGETNPSDITATREFFAARGLAFAVRMPGDPSPNLAGALAGMRLTPPIPGMVLDAPPADPPVPAGLDIEQVTAESMDDWIDVLAEVFSMERAATVAVIPLEMPDVPYALFLGRVNGRTVATSCVIVSEELAGIYCVGTLDDVRGRGYGAALTAAAGAWGLRNGAPSAMLQASAAGFPVYERMGFRHVRDYANFVSG